MAGLFDDVPMAGGGGAAAPADGVNPETGRMRLTVTPRGAGASEESAPGPAQAAALAPRARELAIRTVLGEAADQGDDGMAAVANVIRNRVDSGRYGDGPIGVISKKAAFEPWSTQAGRTRMFGYAPDSPAYQQAAAAIDGAFATGANDPTGGATHFVAPRAQTALGRPMPSWAQGDPLASAGGHLFYAPEGVVRRAGAAPPTDISAQSRQPASPTPTALPPAAPVAPAAAPAAGLFDDIPLAATARPDAGRLDATLRGAAAGAGLNFDDEMYGASKAAGLPDMPPGARISMLAHILSVPVGAARILYEQLSGDPHGTANAAYDKAVGEARAGKKSAEEQHPGFYTAGNVAGAMALPVGGMANAATLPARIARTAAVGGAQGAVAGAGEGENLGDRATKAATGAVVGTALGAGGQTVLEGGGKIISAVAQPAAAMIRGALNPEAEAARRVTSAITRDIKSGSAEMSPSAFGAAQRSGAPVAVADLGGETTRALARSSANTSPEGRAALQKLADDRFEGQAGRATQFIGNMVGGSVDTTASRAALRSQAQTVNRPAYAKAYRDGSGPLWDEGFQQIAAAPVVQDAIKAATRTGANRAAIEGFTPIKSPFRFGEDGRMVPSGEAAPNLQFWDHVKRNLDDAINKLDRAGEGSAAKDAKELRAALVGHLDNLVPSYQEARAGAARFFGAEDAMSAGENFVRSGMTISEARAALAKMTPDERGLFRQGFAAKFIDDINGTRDRVNVMNKIDASPTAREKLRMVFGGEGYSRIRAYTAIEQAMDKMRGALGNSTSVRQYMELGLAGGVGGYGAYNSDPEAATKAAMTWAVLRGHRAIDQRVARRVADMLASSDPAVLAKGVDIVSRNKAMTEAFQNFDARLSGAVAQQASDIAPMQALGVGRADGNQKDVPRPRGQ